MAEITMADFKARNAEAQRINMEIQKAQGARDENERQFKRLCAEYAATYGETVDENNLEAILERVTAEVNAQAEIQAQAIEAAHKGIVTHKPVAVSGTANNMGSGTANNAVVAGNNAVVAGNNAAVTGNSVVAGYGIAGTENPVAGNGAVAGIPNGAIVAGNGMTGAPNNVVVAGNGMAQGIPNGSAQGIAPTQAPVFGQQMTLDEPKPVSAANLPGTAVAQSNTQPNLTQPKEAINHTQMQATSPINGWTPAQGANVDFNTMLGGKFGG